MAEYRQFLVKLSYLYKTLASIIQELTVAAYVGKITKHFLILRCNLLYFYPIPLITPQGSKSPPQFCMNVLNCKRQCMSHGYLQNAAAAHTQSYRTDKLGYIGKGQYLDGCPPLLLIAQWEQQQHVLNGLPELYITRSYNRTIINLCKLINYIASSDHKWVVYLCP